MLKRFTTLLLLLSCTLVTALEWIGNGRSITCIQVTTRNSVFQSSIFNIFQEGPDDSWNIPPNVINTYCYIMWVNSKIFLKGKLSQVYVHPPQAACRRRHRRECGGTGGGRLQSKVCQINCSLFSKCAKLTPLWKVILCGTEITEFNQSNSLTSY